MRTTFIELFLAVMFIAFTIQSCNHKTSMSYELGKETRNSYNEFKRGWGEVNGK